MFIFTESDICDDQNNLQKATEFSVWAAQETAGINAYSCKPNSGVPNTKDIDQRTCTSRTKDIDVLYVHRLCICGYQTQFSPNFVRPAELSKISRANGCNNEQSQSLSLLCWTCFSILSLQKFP